MFVHGGLYPACIGYEKLSKQREVETWKGAPRGVQMGHFLTLFSALHLSHLFFFGPKVKKRSPLDFSKASHLVLEPYIFPLYLMIFVFI